MNIKNKFAKRLIVHEHMGYRTSKSLKKLKADGAAAIDFQEILDSYFKGNYKSHLEAGTLDEYQYGVMTERKVGKNDFIRLMNRVYGVDTVVNGGVVGKYYVIDGTYFDKDTNEPIGHV